MARATLAFTLLLLFTIIITASNCCNQAVCASRISKCMLVEDCKCAQQDPECSRNCYRCLGAYYFECCSCLDMCPDKSSTQDYSLLRGSHVEDIDGIHSLFEVLTAEPDPLKLWTAYTIPGEEKKVLTIVTAESATGNDKEFTEVTVENCTVIFTYQCMSQRKCKNFCQSMGASSIRWFYDGCCQCIGNHCLNYGIDRSRCGNCPPDNEEDTDDDFLNYSSYNSKDDENVIDDEEYDDFDDDYDYFLGEESL